ncbi:MAG: hypothetical protein DF168_00345 [Candidatus Moanabacter tarae]|uniref:Uncharacterized protein n=1 Tax=Candidatus Moanibacter tarae TaxID=2200854 RepID=A0A2Z4ACX6_9BACT|nr:MAG: hypothetical protein DF168_00345 [Candidatus Moanabacter tarae]
MELAIIALDLSETGIANQEQSEDLLLQGLYPLKRSIKWVESFPHLGSQQLFALSFSTCSQ